MNVTNTNQEIKNEILFRYITIITGIKIHL